MYHQTGREERNKREINLTFTMSLNPVNSVETFLLYPFLKFQPVNLIALRTKFTTFSFGKSHIQPIAEG